MSKWILKLKIQVVISASLLQFSSDPVVAGGEVVPDRAEPVDRRLRLPERRDGGGGRHPPLGPPPRAAQPARRAAPAAVPPRRRPHVGGGGDVALQPGTEL